MNKWQLKSEKCITPHIKKLNDNQRMRDGHFISKRVNSKGVEKYYGQSLDIEKKGDVFKKSDLVEAYGIEQVEAMTDYKETKDKIYKLESEVEKLKRDYIKSTEDAYLNLKMKRSWALTDAKREIYHEYLKSNDWKLKREEALDVYGKSCDVCYSEKDGLHVHHMTYKNIFNENMQDLQILCPSCHEKEHSK